MPSNESEAKNKELFLELLYRRERDGLLRYVSVILRKCGSGHASVADRAEDVVQELFYLAWEKADILFESESPVGWLYNAAKLKVHESLREERKWIKHLTLSTSGSGKGQPTRIPVEWTCLMSPEEYELMHKLYIDGYTYKELCDSMGVKKSTLAMRIHRIKERLQKYLEDL